MAIKYFFVTEIIKVKEFFCTSFQLSVFPGTVFIMMLLLGTYMLPLVQLQDTRIQMDQRYSHNVLFF